MAEGDFVIVHGRFSGFGLPVNWIAADIVRVKDGILVEHWDVIQAKSRGSTQKAACLTAILPARAPATTESKHNIDVSEWHVQWLEAGLPAAGQQT